MTDDLAGLRKHLDMLPLWRDPSFRWSIRTTYVLSGRLERYDTKAHDAEPIASVEELCSMTEQEILQRPNACAGTIDEIRDRLSERGLELKA
jgi:hypothetical protein